MGKDHELQWKFLPKKNFQMMLGRKRLRQSILSSVVEWMVLGRWLFRWMGLQNLWRIILCITQNWWLMKQCLNGGFSHELLEGWTVNEKELRKLRLEIIVAMLTDDSQLVDQLKVYLNWIHRSHRKELLKPSRTDWTVKRRLSCGFNVKKADRKYPS